MPRAPFNTTCDIYGGPGTINAGIVKATVNCRLVRQTGIAIVGADAPIRVAWITMHDAFPVGSWSHPPMGFKPSLADQFAVPSSNDPEFWCLYVEEVLWKSQPLYYRACVAYLPLLPDSCDCNAAHPCNFTPESPADSVKILINAEPTDVLSPSIEIKIRSSTYLELAPSIGIKTASHWPTSIPFPSPKIRIGNAERPTSESASIVLGDNGEIVLGEG